MRMPVTGSSQLVDITVNSAFPSGIPFPADWVSHSTLAFRQ